MSIPRHLTTEELEAGLAHIERAPRDEGVLELIVRRPEVDARVAVDEGRLDPAVGLVGDNWALRRGHRSPDTSPDRDTQITIMNSRAIALIADSRDRWPLAGDQLFVDLDLSGSNLPPGTRLAVGEAILEVTSTPHNGCAKFAARFGRDALKFVNSPAGRGLRLRGLYARVVTAGQIRIGDSVRKIVAV